MLVLCGALPVAAARAAGGQGAIPQGEATVAGGRCVGDWYWAGGPSGPRRLLQFDARGCDAPVAGSTVEVGGRVVGRTVRRDLQWYPRRVVWVADGDAR